MRSVKAKDFLPHGHDDWFKKPIPAPDTFEKGNMANISPTITVNIPALSRTYFLELPSIPRRSQLTKHFSKSFAMCSPGHIQRCPN